MTKIKPIRLQPGDLVIYQDDCENWRMYLISKNVDYGTFSSMNLSGLGERAERYLRHRGWRCYEFYEWSNGRIFRHYKPGDQIDLPLVWKDLSACFSKN